MKSDDALRKDVFAEGAPAGLREAMVRESLGVVRRRNRMRNIQRMVSVVAVLSLVAVFAWRSGHKHSTTALTKAAEQKPYRIVHTQPLPPAMCITTHALNTVETSPLTPIQIVETKPNGYRLLNDSQLLAMMAPRPCMLVQVAPGSERLVFANTNDAQGLPF